MFFLMLFMFFFFLGFAVMFYYLVHRIDGQFQVLGEEHAQLRVLLRAVESRLDKLESERDDTDQPISVSAMADAAGHDPLLHLSFEEPVNPAAPADPGLELDFAPEPRCRDAGL